MKEFCLAQWYENVHEKALRVDKFDKKHDRIKFRWYKIAGIFDCLRAGKAYVLILVESKGEVGHRVERYLEHSHLHPDACLKLTADKRFMECPCCLSDMYDVS